MQATFQTINKRISQCKSILSNKTLASVSKRYQNTTTLIPEDRCRTDQSVFLQVIPADQIEHSTAVDLVSDAVIMMMMTVSFAYRLAPH